MLETRLPPVPRGEAVGVASPIPRPDWIKARAPMGERYDSLVSLVRGQRLHTVCEEARCPNIGDCWNRGTATFMILGDTCTRACGFCAVKTGLAAMPPDPDEPRRVAEAIQTMGLRHAVITSVNRDEQKDGAAWSFSETIRLIREKVPGCQVEVLIPDFKGNWTALQVVIEARPDILNHNTETVPRLYRKVRPGANFRRSLELLARSKEARLLTKSGIMVGLGEEWDEILETIRAIREARVDILTVGQYLRPSLDHLPILKYYSPDEFARIRDFGLSIGFGHVESGPLVRSSYHADEQVPKASAPAWSFGAMGSEGRPVERGR